jgi:hypothetical protein
LRSRSAQRVLRRHGRRPTRKRTPAQLRRLRKRLPFPPAAAPSRAVKLRRRRYHLIIPEWPSRTEKRPKRPGATDARPSPLAGDGAVCHRVAVDPDRARSDFGTPYLIAAYAAFVGEAFEGFIVDTDHWRHFFLPLGLVWGLTAASLNLRRRASCKKTKSSSFVPPSPLYKKAAANFFKLTPSVRFREQSDDYATRVTAGRCAPASALNIEGRSRLPHSAARPAGPLCG